MVTHCPRGSLPSPKLSLERKALRSVFVFFLGKKTVGTMSLTAPAPRLAVLKPASHFWNLSLLLLRGDNVPASATPERGQRPIAQAWAQRLQPRPLLPAANRRPALRSNRRPAANGQSERSLEHTKGKSFSSDEDTSWYPHPRRSVVEANLFNLGK